ncbi:MAG: hypothetical protein EOP45_08910 [Sphingobacteriaceae bacterium]|nr:MAG: hypothetical protein EOP45_08910 [Sphingobacteriaceae bacterium]
MTFVTNAGTIRGTVAVQSTFWSTIFVRVAEVFGQTLTRTGAVLFTTNGIRATRTGDTWIVLFVLNDLFNGTLNKRIANIVSKTFTYGRMRNYVTFCIQTTNAIGARVFAMPINTGQMISALGVRHALGSTIRGSTNKIGQTVARVTVTVHSTFSIWTTW